MPAMSQTLSPTLSQTLSMRALIHRARGARSAFTLIEMLLVIGIIAILVATSTPYLVKSMRGNRLRTAGRSVVQLARYARTMAILNGESYTISFDIGASKVSVASGGAAAEPDEESDPDAWYGDESGGDGTIESRDVGIPVITAGGGVTRPLDRVRIVSFYTRGGSSSGNSIVYRHNGRNTPYEVILADQDGRELVIRVDAVGTVMTSDDARRY